MSSDLASKGLVEIAPNVFIRQKSEPIKSIVADMDVPVKKNKYNVSPKEERMMGEKIYDSKLERDYAKHLLLLVAAKEVHHFIEQIPFEIVVNKIKICKYVLDFKITYTSDKIEYIDCKGFLTPNYRLKKKLMLAIHGIQIKEIFKGDF